MEILSSYTDGFCRLCDRIAKKSNEYGPMKTINTERAIHTEPAIDKGFCREESFIYISHIKIISLEFFLL